MMPTVVPSREDGEESHAPRRERSCSRGFLTALRRFATPPVRNDRWIVAVVVLLFVACKREPIHIGSKNYFLTRGGDDWWSGDGKKLDLSSADSVIGKIRDLQAMKFTDSGFAMPITEISVTSNVGKRFEKLLISKHADEYIAERAGARRALCELAARTITEERCWIGVRGCPAVLHPDDRVL